MEFYPITLKGALSSIDWMLSRDDGCTRLVVTANPIMVMTAQRDQEFSVILKNAHLLVPDGIGILWASRKLGGDLPQRITGMDLAMSLLEKKPSPGFFFLGGRPGVAEKAKEHLEKTIPHLKVLGTHHGYFQSEEEPGVVEKIRQSGAKVLFVSMGSPKQEKFIWRNRRSLGSRVALGLGGVLDVLSQEKKRAPQWVQNAGLEWLYRLLKEPRRFKNDLLLAEFAMRVEMASLRGKTKPSSKEGKGDEGFERLRKS